MKNTIEQATEHLRELQKKVDRPMNSATEIFWAEVLVDYADKALNMASVVFSEAESCNGLHSTDWYGKCFKCGQQAFTREVYGRGEQGKLNTTSTCAESSGDSNVYFI